jgi:3-hydroxyacyl-CoA dehydrogenase
VAAVQGMALGGGCEFAMHAAKRVLALESYVGLVEAGVGLIPAGGGCKEFAVRAADWAAQSALRARCSTSVQPVFMTIAMAKVSKSAHEAIDFGFAKAVRHHPVQRQRTALCRHQGSPRPGRCRLCPPVDGARRSGGRQGRYRHLEMMLVNMREGGMISAHDYKVARPLPSPCVAAKSRRQPGR